MNSRLRDRWRLAASRADLNAKIKLLSILKDYLMARSLVAMYGGYSRFDARDGAEGTAFVNRRTAWIPARLLQLYSVNQCQNQRDWPGCPPLAFFLKKPALVDSNSGELRV